MTVLGPEGKYFLSPMLSFRIVHWNLSWGYSADKPCCLWEEFMSSAEAQVHKNRL